MEIASQHVPESTFGPHPPSMRNVLPENRVTHGLQAVIDVAVLSCGWWLLALSTLTCVEILGRKFFGFSLQGVDEIGSYTFAIVTAFGFSYALISAGHTRVDFLLSRFALRTRALLNGTAMVVLAALTLLATYRAWHVLAESHELVSTAPTPLATPLWYPQTIWFAAWLLFAVTALVAAVHACQLALRRDWAELNLRYGPQTLEEEIESESAVRLK
jgi:TRAP-type mannitol/chloroaromatic compound transport system permease small subunit